MEEIIRIVLELGILTAIAILYLFDKTKQSKKIETTLAEIKSYWDKVNPVIEILRDETLGRTAVLNTMQGSIDNVSAVVQGVDKITGYMQSDIREIRTILNKGGDFRA